jgi:hypothetical protein
MNPDTSVYLHHQTDWIVYATYGFVLLICLYKIRTQNTQYIKYKKFYEKH